MARILILGGTGFVGRALCDVLLSDPRLELTVPTRSLARHKAQAMRPRLQLVAADVHDDAALAALLPGHDAVVNLVAILHGSPAAFERAHCALPRRLALAMRTQGTLRRLVHVSALGVPDGPASDAPSEYLRSKARGEAALREAAASAYGLQLTMLRPSVIFGAEDRFLNLFATLQRVAPVMPLGGADARFQPVWVQDVARAIARCLQAPQPPSLVYECAGPRVMSLAEIVRFAGQCAGVPRPVLPLPQGLAMLQAWGLGLLPGEPLMSVDNLRSMRTPNVATGAHPGLQALGIAPSSLEAIAPGYLRPACDPRDRFRRSAGR